MKSSLYSRPNKPKTVTVHDRTRTGAPEMALPVHKNIVTLDRSTECHVTPPDVAAYMVDVLELKPTHRLLEPQAGTGNLAQAALDDGHPSDRMTLTERSGELCHVLRERFESVTTIQTCFLEFENEGSHAQRFDRVLANPPFRKTKQHMEAALRLLSRDESDDAMLVALVPITYEHPYAELIDVLPNDTFALAKVNTKIIRIAL